MTGGQRQPATGRPMPIKSGGVVIVDALGDWDKIMRMTVLALVALMGGCSCERTPDSQALPAEASAKIETSLPVAADVPTERDTAAAAARADAAIAAASAVSSVHAYLGAVAAKDWKKADAFWTGGKPPPQPDDQALRAVQDLRSMRINNERPTSLDQQTPPQALEIPVTLRVRSESGIGELKGWYRLRRTIGGKGWEITSASLQPTLD